ncbi:MAG: mannose-6-phosphate isomerase-like protein (cupin superfamily) [Hyphomicrobiaceae bacterium]|jgi:mannose-6-phosphate isomerase-like protein (cupin superfamily)
MLQTKGPVMTKSNIRRVVTGHDGNGKAVIISDGPTPHVKTSPHRPGVVINNLWTTDSMPVPIHGSTDPVTAAMKLEPVANGMNFRVVEFPPEADYINNISDEDAHKAFDAMGAGHALEGDAHGGKARHPFMHKTSTLDYAIILSGEVYMMLDEDEVLMKAGDVCIQRATNHVWSNRSNEICRIAFILIDGQET